MAWIIQEQIFRSGGIAGVVNPDGDPDGDPEADPEADPERSRSNNCPLQING